MQTPDVPYESLIRRIYNINEKDFDSVAMEVWNYQYQYNALYHSYIDMLGVPREKMKAPEQVPFLPVSLYKEHDIRSGIWKEEAVFESSGTSDSIPGRHLIRDLQWYYRIAEKCFSSFFGDPRRYAWLGLLPSYLERPDSSLVDMVRYFMEESGRPENAFFPHANEDLILKMKDLQRQKQPTILIGVTFALLDLFESHTVPVWDELTVIETGGMKGRGPEITREELYERMRRHHSRLRICSEYGMTELLSQAYKVNSHFIPGPTMKILIRDISDPFQILGYGERGVINVIDLANVHSCAFIATDDIGVLYPDGSFDVLGRLDNSDLRGCNLMYS